MVSSAGNRFVFLHFLVSFCLASEAVRSIHHLFIMEEENEKTEHH